MQQLKKYVQLIVYVECNWDTLYFDYDSAIIDKGETTPKRESISFPKRKFGMKSVNNQFPFLKKFMPAPT